MIVEENNIERQFSFWADTKEQEAKIFEQLIAELSKYDDLAVFCYGSFEKTFLTRMRRSAKSKRKVDKVLDALTNILSIIYIHIYFPTFSNGLKDIAGFLGYSWSEAEASGLQSVVWRMNWERTYEESWKQTLITYNLEDCIALKKVTDLLQTITNEINSDEPVKREDDGPAIGFVKDVEALTDYHKWGKVDFVLPDYEYVNERAYFDYQRDRVYIRNSKVLKKRKAEKKKYVRRRLPPSKTIIIAASKCPNCKSNNVKAGIKKQVRNQEPRLKTAYDLAYTSTGVRRTVIECRTSVHQCLSCRTEFVPQEHQFLDRHFHGLKSWAMFHHVAYRISLEMIPKMLSEFFGLRVFRNEVHMFKSLMAKYYKNTCRKLMEGILAGPLLHVDETQVKLQTGKGYVWVFTNLEEVVYMYRPTRESDFLHELLKGFRGVLVSDFYSAYDSIECPQQKCLIHLIRDINQDLLNNPFDQDLKSITQPFGVLLRNITGTVDERGLKERYLRRHRKEVDEFFDALRNQIIGSEAAKSLRDRLIKYETKLFTYIKYDGVPWNNNNAEHAIKQFAYYRENTVGTMRETGLNDYLTLLSLCQTCKYKGVSFLKFLLSKQRNIDTFCVRRVWKQPPFRLEVYPKGFLPIHIVNLHKNRLAREAAKAKIQEK